MKIQTNPIIKQADRLEVISVCVLLLAILIFNLVTAMVYPAVWLDEVAYSDPAANFILGRGFTSTAWFMQAPDQFWAGNTPLHQLLLIEWLRIFGFSPLAVRSINYVWFVLGTYFIWRFCVRSQLIPQTRWRLLMIALLACESAISFSYRSGRPDMIGYCLCAGTLLATTVSSIRVRGGILLALGFLFPWAGLQLLLFLVLATGLVLIFFGWRNALNGICIGIGAALGLAGLYLFYRSHGVWNAFVSSVKLCSSGQIGDIYGHARLNVVPEMLIRDRSAPFLLLAAIILTVWYWKSRNTVSLKSTLFALSAGLCIPLVMHFVGVFPIYYGWMTAVPVTLAVCHFLSMRPVTPLWIKAAVGILLVGSMIIGLPIRLAAAIFAPPDKSYDAVSEFISSHLKSSDEACINDAAYYPAIISAKRIYTMRYMQYAMTPEEKSSVTVLIISPSNVSAVTNAIPAHWILEAKFDVGIRTNHLPAFVIQRFESGQAKSVHDSYHFLFFRRSGENTGAMSGSP